MAIDTIAILDNNIIQFFENTNSNSLKLHNDYVALDKINREIIFDKSEDKIKFPSANLDTKQIILQGKYLAHLWSFIYAIFVIYEEGIQNKLLDKTFNGCIDFNPPLLNRAKQLLSWSISLKNQYSNWDLSLPNPKQHSNEEEKNYAEKVNNLYQNAVVFLLYHEMAHIVNNHKSFWPFSNNDDNIEMEKEADEFAFSMLVEDNEKSKVEKDLSIMLLLGSSLFLTNNFDSIIKVKHPDTDNRLKILLDKLAFEKEENKFYIWYLGCYILNVFLQLHKIDYHPDISEDAEELFFKYLSKIDEYKTKK
jgi:hypothetical protein